MPGRSVLAASDYNAWPHAFNGQPASRELSSPISNDNPSHVAVHGDVIYDGAWNKVRSCDGPMIGRGHDIRI